MSGPMKTLDEEVPGALTREMLIEQLPRIKNLYSVYLSSDGPELNSREVTQFTRMTGDKIQNFDKDGKKIDYGWTLPYHYLGSREPHYYCIFANYWHAIAYLHRLRKDHELAGTA